MRQCGNEQTREGNANPSAGLAFNGGRSCISLESEDADRALAGRGVLFCGLGDAKAGEGKPEGRRIGCRPGRVIGQLVGCVALLGPRGSRVLVSMAWHVGIPLGTETLLQSCPDCQRAVCVMVSLTQQMKSGPVPGLAAGCSSSYQVKSPAHQDPASAASTSVAVAGSGSQPRLLESSQHSTQVINICVLVHLDVVVGLRLGRWRSVGELDARRQHRSARCCCRCHARPAPHGRQFRRTRTVTVARTASGLVTVHKGGGGEGAKPCRCAC